MSENQTVLVVYIIDSIFVNIDKVTHKQFHV